MLSLLQHFRHTDLLPFLPSESDTWVWSEKHHRGFVRLQMAQCGNISGMYMMNPTMADNTKISAMVLNKVDNMSTPILKIKSV